MSILVRGLVKRFGSFVALDDVTADIPSGQLVALLGPSGSGKTTLLRVIAGLEGPDHGTVHFDGEDATTRHVRDRRVGFVFQHYALFRHLSVFENVAFGLRVRPRATRPTDGAIRSKVMELLELVQLDWLAERFPAQLSGGQRQRVALARALAVEPRVLLLDEPFGALDTKVRKELRRWLRRLQDELNLTTVLVTHDQEEAMEVADRVVIMNHGRIEQVGTPEEVYQAPASPFVYSFLGSVNLFHGRYADGHLELAGTSLAAPDIDNAMDRGVVYVRPHDLDLDPGDDGWSIPVVVERLRYIGATARLDLVRESDGQPMEAELARDRIDRLQLVKGTRIRLAPRRYRVFADPQPPRTGAAR